MNESDLVDKMIAALTKNWGGFAFKVHGGMFQRKGMPDILWWYSNHSFAFEAKLDPHTYGLTALQYIKLQKLEAEGVHVATVYSVEQLLDVVRGVLHARD